MDKTLTGWIRTAIYDPGALVQRNHEVYQGTREYEPLDDWKIRAVLKALEGLRSQVYIVETVCESENVWDGVKIHTVCFTMDQAMAWLREYTGEESGDAPLTITAMSGESARYGKEGATIWAVHTEGEAPDEAWHTLIIRRLVTGNPG